MAKALRVPAIIEQGKLVKKKKKIKFLLFVDAF